ncbi:DNA sulfur modification protein DndD [Terribacillus saccharophilus]|uniref:DNA sulfur modification protein DndD n=1 Tax=Terribacillus saccharophilus TaxID=361277 RepID=UPI000C9AA8DA|nr:DNA sulfur modification protein DndD [Terribacillus goriensis]
MLFKKIILSNIGPYESINTFSFISNDESNCTLIGGKNGSGKTTFLNSVRLALYGPLAYGFKTITSEYLKKIGSLLNSNAQKHGKDFKIQLDFSTVENLKRIDVSIIRIWTIKDKSLKENVTVIKENVHLSEMDKDKFFMDLRTSFPPSLLELCLFDGEEITQLTNEDKLSSYLQELSTKIFNLDLFQSLESDLKNYLSQSSRSSTEAKLEDEKELLKTELSQKISELKKVHQEIDNNNNELTESSDLYHSLKKDFSLHGGLVMEQRNKLQEEINSLEGTRKHFGDQIKEAIAKDLPFFIAFPQLIRLVEQLKHEENFHISNVLKEKINNLPVNDILQDLGFTNNPGKEEQFKSALAKRLADVNEATIIHSASKTEAQQVYTLLSFTNLKQLNKISDLIQSNKEHLLTLQKLKKQLKDNDSSPEFENMLTEMEEYSQKMAYFETSLTSLEATAEQLQDEIELLNKKYERVNHEHYNIQKTKASFEESEKIINISKRFQEKQLRNKVKDIEYFSSRMFKDLLRKKEFINQIQIDHQTFELKVLNKDNVAINKDILSAGEKELLVLSVIWGTITSSKKELPFILDTLLGRLDSEHKHSIITKLIPKFGKQTIILSTDSEIDKQLYKELSKFVANEYTLNYDVSAQRTNIEKHFFNLEAKKVTM